MDGYQFVVDGVVGQEYEDFEQAAEAFWAKWLRAEHQTHRVESFPAHYVAMEQYRANAASIQRNQPYEQVTSENRGLFTEPAFDQNEDKHTMRARIQRFANDSKGHYNEMEHFEELRSISVDKSVFILSGFKYDFQSIEIIKTISRLKDTDFSDRGEVDICVFLKAINCLVAVELKSNGDCAHAKNQLEKFQTFVGKLVPNGSVRVVLLAIFQPKKHETLFTMKDCLLATNGEWSNPQKWSGWKQFYDQQQLASVTDSASEIDKLQKLFTALSAAELLDPATAETSVRKIKRFNLSAAQTAWPQLEIIDRILMSHHFIGKSRPGIERTTEKFRDVLSIFSLTSSQRYILESSQNYILLNGCPGTGKTVLLLFKALESLQDNQSVVIVCPRISESVFRPVANAGAQIIPVNLFTKQKKSEIPNADVYLIDDFQAPGVQDMVSASLFEKLRGQPPRVREQFCPSKIWLAVDVMQDAFASKYNTAGVLDHQRYEAEDFSDNPLLYPILCDDFHKHSMQLVLRNSSSIAIFVKQLYSLAKDDVDNALLSNFMLSVDCGHCVPGQIDIVAVTTEDQIRSKFPATLLELAAVYPIDQLAVILPLGRQEFEETLTEFLAQHAEFRLTAEELAPTPPIFSREWRAGIVVLDYGCVLTGTHLVILTALALAFSRIRTHMTIIASQNTLSEMASWFQECPIELARYKQ